MKMHPDILGVPKVAPQCTRILDGLKYQNNTSINPILIFYFFKGITVLCVKR